MGAINPYKPVLLLVAVFSVSEEAVQTARELLEKEFGPIAKESPVYSFNSFTNYYAKEMGNELPKKFWVFERLVDPGTLADIKIL
ncbi:MAG: DUF4416 family protein, partial [Thermoguttaceae bacterium]|nr:DUF4416 family protein [Thermoguttaceae bacterium]